VTNASPLNPSIAAIRIHPQLSPQRAWVPETVPDAARSCARVCGGNGMNASVYVSSGGVSLDPQEMASAGEIAADEGGIVYDL
jgi:hypothetical protein